MLFNLFDSREFQMEESYIGSWEASVLEQKEKYEQWMQEKIMDSMVDGDRFMDHEKLNELYLFDDAAKWLQRKILSCGPNEVRKLIGLKMALANCLMEQNKNKEADEILNEI
mmetsp:Transcript_21802/g.18769  ORF Transcript_21802/g.18769 Transcript_21802/m.18769 type:complete len:112 (+) Transcript_21802:638-973(+)